ncbi:MAG TPA: cytochrome c oxidase assembly factor Coa1 family protein [Usitatibacter sp.]|nr:cytochrome c oxidase assembly factor Coa1 family protein [Usitatibacter sp.]
MNTAAAAPAKSTTKRTWVIVGIVLAVVVALLVAFAAAMFYMVSGMLKDSDAYRTGIQTLEANAQAMQILGPPIKAGFPSGSVRTSGASGEAELAIPVEGQKARGILYIEATKAMGVWKAQRMELEIEGRTDRMDLIGNATSI